MKAVYNRDGIELYCGDFLDGVVSAPGVDVVVADPPYAETSLKWDRAVKGWLTHARAMLVAAGSLWCFGSLRFFMEQAAEFKGWRFAQDLVWEKHNGTNSAADRFRRVHEAVAQFYPANAKWADIFKAPVTTPDATARQVRRKKRPAHWGNIGEHEYKSEDGGPRLMRSVLRVRGCHGSAVHPTQKPEGIVEPLLRYSCPRGGLVLDPFAGSGTTLLVARQLGMRAIGFEISADYCERAVERLSSTLPLTEAA